MAREGVKKKTKKTPQRRKYQCGGYLFLTSVDYPPPPKNNTNNSFVTMICRKVIKKKSKKKKSELVGILFMEHLEEGRPLPGSVLCLEVALPASLIVS